VGLAHAYAPASARLVLFMTPYLFLRLSRLVTGERRYCCWADGGRTLPSGLSMDQERRALAPRWPAPAPSNSSTRRTFGPWHSLTRLKVVGVHRRALLEAARKEGLPTMKRLLPAATMTLVAVVIAGLFIAHVSTARAGGGGAHAPIVIQSNADFTNCACVTGGKGTTSSPWIIGPWTINNVNDVAVSIDGTNVTQSFELLNLTIAGNSTSTDTGIVLNHINPGGSQSIVAKVYGVQTSIQTNNVGILVENSSYVTLDGAGENPKGPGIAETGAGTINKNVSGAVDVESSSHITVEGWQMSTNGPSINPNWVTLDPSVSYWAVGGVRFFGVTDSTIDHNAANNDTDVSYSVFDSGYNTLSNNTADYPYTMNFLITDGSSYNTVTGNDASTADFIGLLLADPLPGTSTYPATHDNTITGNTIHTDGPIGRELSPVDITPAFLGGIVVLNGTYNNHITNNTTFGSFGSDLGWAQAVPNSSSAIGVTTYPPTLHCNVTASEGGGGVSNLNGNTWTGNTYQTIDSCLPAQ
jgi:parallel beta-helix repeat protein